MIQRNLVTYIILTIVTCGIFGIYWYYCVANDLYNARNSTLPTTPIVTILLNIVTCGIYGIYAYYQWGKVMPEICAEKGLVVEDRSIIYLLLSIFGFAIVNLALIQNDLNMLENKQNPQ